MLSNAHIVNPTFVANAVGVYSVQLIVNDGTVNSLPATVTITANPQNQAPEVNAGPNQTITLPTNTVTLNGTATDDGLPSGVLNIAWSQVSGPATVTFSSPQTAVTQATLPVAGTYQLRLTASDTQLSSSSNVTVTVNPPTTNQPPVVSAGPGGEVSLPSAFQLNGSATDDGLPVGKLILQWTQITGPSTAVFSNPTQAVTSVTFDAPGTYVFRLTASDTQLSSSANATVVVLTNNGGKNQPPFVDAGPAQTVTLPNAAILNGTAVDDGLPNGTLLVAWSKVSGPGNVVFANPSNPKTTATFSVAGDYILQLSASDTQLVSSATVQITAQQLIGTRSSKGNEFWLMFDESFSTGTPSLFITSETNASGTVTVPGISTIAPQSFSVLAGQIIEIDLPPAVFTTGSDTIEHTGIHVVADHEVTVYGSNFVQFATDAYLGLPVSALGKEYVVASYFSTPGPEGPSIGTEFGVVPRSITQRSPSLLQLPLGAMLRAFRITWFFIREEPINCSHSRPIVISRGRLSVLTNPLRSLAHRDAPMSPTSHFSATTSWSRCRLPTPGASSSWRSRLHCAKTATLCVSSEPPTGPMFRSTASHW